MAMHWLAAASGLSVPLRLTYGAVMVLGTLGLSNLISLHRLGVPLEMLRAILVFGALAGDVWFTPVAAWAKAVAVAALLVSLSMLVMIRAEQQRWRAPPPIGAKAVPQ